MENSGFSSGLGASQNSEGINSKFKVIQQMASAQKSSLKSLAPEAEAVRDMGAKFDMGSKIGMNKVNTAESTKILPGPEVGKGGLVNEVF
ncbi:MAG: hypothetical protein HOB32_10855 [Nitrospina sp.]|jgi:hypothetical protein|nr:hypothetical protein [Nitrospina sp.]MBT6602132.1 hypothetical protein [Nitrospina sp.]